MHGRTRTDGRGQRGRMLVAAIVLLALLPGAAWAQKAAALAPPLHKNGAKFKSAFRSVVAKSVASTARVYCDDREAALATVVDKDGLLLTKASELDDDDIVCRFSNGKEYAATIVAVDKASDIALLKVKAGGLKPVQWGDPKKTEVGFWVATVGPGKDPVSIGVVSVPRRRINRSGGVLGIIMGDVKDGIGIVIRQVAEGSGAEDAGLKEGDVVTHVNDKATKNQLALRNLVTNHNPGDVLSIRYQRGDKKSQVDVVLGSRDRTFASLDERAAKRSRLRGDLSERKDGFDAVIQHDTVLRPQDCGGPLVTLDGKVVGLNIARAGRVASYALPADKLQGLVRSLKAKMK